MMLSIQEQLRRKLIVSCQAWPGDPLDNVDAIRRMSLASLRGGAAGLRIDSPQNIAAIRAETTVPIIGLYKHYYGDQIRITPTFAAAKQLADAGASIIALDCTVRPPLAGEPWQQIIGRIHSELHLPVMADISTKEEALAAQAAGADYVGTTLAGYTEYTASLKGIAWALIDELVALLKVPLVVEGRISTPEDARRALELGAFAVVVGSAVTRPCSIVGEYVRQMRHLSAGKLVLGVDIGRTSIKAGLVNSAGEILMTTQVPTCAQEGRNAIVASVEKAIEEVLNHPSPVKVGAYSFTDTGHNLGFNSFGIDGFT